jgi:succinate dehydrogenase/fumarate reductase flavoprotein subunit
VAGYANKLATIEAQLNKLKTVLVSRMNQAKSSASAAQKKRWYWLALGPFGNIPPAEYELMYYQQLEESAEAA